MKKNIIAFLAPILFSFSLVADPLTPVSTFIDTQSSPTCMALRGNGNKVSVTFGALASVLEETGPAHSLLGSSSGSVAAFFYEAMLSNPALYMCGPNHCTEKQIGMRLSLGFKTLLSYARVLKRTDKSTQRVLTIMDNPKSLQGILAILGAAFDPRINGFINWETILPNWSAIYNWKKLYRWGQRIVDQTCSASIRTPQSPLSLIRDGIVDVDHLVNLLGVIADFYAGYGPTDTAEDWQSFYDICTPKKAQMGLSESSRMPFSENQSCGERFGEMLVSFRKEFFTPIYEPKERKFRPSHFAKLAYTRVKRKPKSLALPIGTMANVFTTTSAFTGTKAYNELARAKKEYRGDIKGAREFAPNWSYDFKVGYMGTPKHLKSAEAILPNLEDLKSKRFLNLGQPSWKVALRASISEPGIRGAMNYDDHDIPGQKVITWGGWVDNHATIFLKSIGCESTIYFTRPGKLSDFAIGAAQQMGADDQFIDEFFNLDNPNSSFSKSIEAADMSLCMDWDQFDENANPADLGYYGYSKAPRMSPEACKNTEAIVVENTMPKRCENR